jgi:DNA-binding IscR family transcriptional regulator
MEVATLSENERKIADAMKDMGATDENKLKTVEDVCRKANMAKNIAANVLLEMANKKIVKRIVRGKSAGYFVMPGF